MKTLFKAALLASLGLLALGCDDQDDGKRKTSTTVQVDSGQRDAQGNIIYTSQTTQYINSQGGQSMIRSDVLQFFGTPENFVDSMSGRDYLSLLFQHPNDPLVELYIPKYTYFQGLAYTPANIKLIGQVRLIGGAVSANSGSLLELASGAMATTNPEYLKERLQPNQRRYTITEWKEVAPDAP